MNKQKLLPHFELNGQSYEIKPTRWLIAEYDKLGEESQLSNEDKANAIKAQSLIGDIQRYAEKVKELEEKYFETFDDEDERKYLKIKALYESKLDELTALEVETGSTTKLQKAGIDLLEKIAIKGLAEQYFNFDEVKAQKVWESYVDTLPNHEVVIEWLTSMSECLFRNEEEVEENSFLSQMRKKAEQRAINRKNGIKKR
jgi:hypothetical protein